MTNEPSGIWAGARSDLRRVELLDALGWDLGALSGLPSGELKK